MPKKLALITSKGTLDWLIRHLYWPPPPPRSIIKYRFFTFYGLSLVKKDLSDLTVSPPCHADAYAHPKLYADDSRHGKHGDHDDETKNCR